MRQLLLYGFGPEADFEGRLVGALERLESGGALRILDVLFVRRDAESGDIDAIDLHGDGAGGVVAPLLNFRLDEGERRRATERTLRANADVVRELGAALEPGGGAGRRARRPRLEHQRSRTPSRGRAGHGWRATSSTPLGWPSSAAELLAAAGRPAG